MALDEVLLNALAEPVVRVYEWQPHTVTLGYGQPLADVDREACVKLGLGLTRRLTGGRAVLHGDELTYSVLVKPEVVGGLNQIKRAYGLISGALAAALKRCGLEVSLGSMADRRSGAATARDPACFAAALGGDLSVAGRKLVGSAQCQRMGGVLQHGSLPRTVNEDQLRQCLRRPTDARRNWTCLAELGVDLSAADFARHLASALEPLLGPLTGPQEPSPAEWDAARDLAVRKYAAEEWLGRV